ncbi:Rab1a [Hexamita inflata]|uniref:Rab1a n=1 Tax=Hexamita inflata TaxID=28002 RepID=A0AA86R1G5_9EUKA|nr:Rab1a [Hexamita inflata]
MNYDNQIIPELINQIKIGIAKESHDILMSALDQLSKIQIISIPSFVNPTRQFKELLLLVKEEMEGQTPWQKTIVVNVAFQMIFRVFIHNKENQIQLSDEIIEECENIVNSQLELIEELNKTKNHISNRQIFYLKVIQQGLHLFKCKQSLSQQIFKYVKQLIGIMFYTFTSDYNELIHSLAESFKTIVKECKVNPSWFFDVMFLILSIGVVSSDQNTLYYLVDYIQSNLEHKWYVLYAALDVIQMMFLNLNDPKEHKYIDFSNVCQCLVTLSQNQHWRVREKILEICLINQFHNNKIIRTNITQLLNNIINNEKESKVLYIANHQQELIQIETCLEQYYQPIKLRPIIINSPEIQYNMILLGDSGSGKSAIMQRLLGCIKQPITKSTIEYDYGILKFNYIQNDKQNVNINLQLFDTCGMEKYQSIPNQIIRQADIILIVFGLNDSKSFDKIDHWIQYAVEKANNNVQYILIGNKSDEQKTIESITFDQIQQKMIKHNIKSYLQCSAKYGKGIAKIIENLIFPDKQIPVPVIIEARNEYNICDDLKSKLVEFIINILHHISR